jgi:hypothetical protein
LDEKSRLLDLDDAFPGTGPDLPHALGHFSGEVEQWLGMRRILAFEHCRFAFIPGPPDLGIKLYAA